MGLNLQLLAQTRSFDPGKTEVVLTPGPAGTPIIEAPTLIGVEAIFSNILMIALSLAGVALFIMFIVGGFKYLTAGGDPKAVEAAKGTLTHAIAGLVVLILAYLILLLIKDITGIDVSIFRIYKP